MSLGSVAQLRQVARNRDLCLLLGAGLVSQTGDWILGTGVAFQIYVLTGSTLASATALLVSQLPQVVFGSVAGVLVDRWDRRRVMITVNLLLALVLAPIMVVHDSGQVWLIYLVLAVSSCLSPFFVSAEASLLPALVGQADGLVTANAANGQARNLARLVGAALGGVLVAGGGLVALAVADMISFALAVGLLLAIRHRPVAALVDPAHHRAHLARDWTDGMRTIRNSRDLLVIAVFFALSGIGEAIMGTLFAPFVHDVLGGSGRAYGTILAAQAVGGIVGGLLVTAFGHRFSPRRLFGVGALLFGFLDLALFLYPLLLPSVPPAIVIIAAVGLPGAALTAGMMTIFQLATTDAVRGRVFGAVTALQNATMLLGTLVAGVVAARVGIVPVIAVQGAVYVLAGLGVLIALRSAARPAPSPVAELERC